MKQSTGSRSLSFSSVVVSLLFAAMATAIIVLIWWRHAYPIVIEKQPLPDGADGRLTLASQLSVLAGADSAAGRHTQAGYLLLAAAALTEFPTDQPLRGIPSTQPVTPTLGERVAAMQFQTAGLGPPFRQFLHQKYPHWDGSTSPRTASD